MDRKRLFKAKIISLLATLLLVGVISTVNSHEVKPATSEVLTNTSMAQVLGGDTEVVLITNNSNIIIGTVVGAAIGFIIAGPAGALEGAFWGSIVFWALW